VQLVRWLILGAARPPFFVNQEDALDPYVNPQTIAARAADWLATIHPFNQHEMELRRDKSALLVIDMQEFFLDPESPSFTCGGLAILPVLQGLIAAFREAGRPVIYTKHVHHPEHLDSGIMGWWWKGMCIEGTPESEIHRDLAPLPLEKVILKHRYSAFYNTDLETILRCLRIEDLVITGIMTNMCCESTARDAYFRDYRVFFLADGTGSINEEMQLASLLNLAFGFAHVTTADRISADLRSPSLAGEPAAGRERDELKLP
jgi:ureidoacrylate peracid hydrolase